MKPSIKRFVELSRLQFYAWLQVVFIMPILLYQLIWFVFGTSIQANCYVYGKLNELENSGTIVYRYQVKNKMYEAYGTRNEMSTQINTIKVKYLSFAASISRIDNFYSHWLGFIITYFIFFTFTTLLFFIPNDTMPANSYFYFTKKRPWVNIIEK